MSLKPLHIALVLLVGGIAMLAVRGWWFARELTGRAAPAAAARGSGELTVYYHERRPYYFHDGQRVTGSVVDPVEAALQLAGIPHHWVALPPAHQLQVLRESREYCAGVGWIATDERRLFARFSVPLHRDGAFVALTRADDARLQPGRPLAALFADSGLTLLVKDAYSYGPEVDALIARLQPRRLSTPAPNDAMLRMLAEHRADYFLLAREEAQALLDGATGNYRLAELPNAPRGVVRHLMFSRAVPESVVQRFDAALRERRDLGPALRQ